MKKSLSVLIIVVSGLIVIALLLGAGIIFGRSLGWGRQSLFPYGLSGWQNNRTSFRTNIMGNGYGFMASNWQENNPNVTPLTMDQTKQAVDAYLSDLNDPNLEVAEIMVFNNNSYAIIVEKDTGIGAMELLIDPENLSVFPEPGPNMMWNLKYGRMNIGNMMGNRYPRYTTQENMTVSTQKASEIAQSYLDEQLPGYQVAEEVTPFYGYYTMDILKDGSPTGMLSINGFTGQVFLHTWHGTFIEMSE